MEEEEGMEKENNEERRKKKKKGREEEEAISGWIWKNSEVERREECTLPATSMANGQIL